MLNFFKQLHQKFGRQKTSSIKVILIGIDYPSHALGKALQARGSEIIAFIDDEPWNHRTKMLGATVHYPSEVAALAERYQGYRVVKFKGGSVALPELVQQQLTQLNVNIIEIDSEALSLEAQLNLLLRDGSDSTT